MRFKTNVKLGLPIVSLLAASLGAACTATPPPRATDGAPVAVAVGRAELTEVASPFEAGGVVRARRSAVIASRVMAPIAEVHVRPGDRRHSGDRLVTLDAREMQANRARASAALASAVETARAAEFDIRAAEAALRLARATHDRIEDLFSKRSATSQELDQAAAGRGGAEAQLASAQAHAAAATAARDAARASLDAAEVGASYAVLSAPFDGVITERTVDPGSMAMPGAPLLTIEDPGVFHLEVTLDEARAASLAVGHPLEVRLDSAVTATGGWSAARVVEIARVDPASHSFLVKIDLPRAATVRSGLFGRARFAGPGRRTLTVPASAILRRGQLTFVWAVDGEGRARLRPITTGVTAQDRVETLAGLEAGDAVVTTPPVSLMDGGRVSATTTSRNAPATSAGAGR